MNIVFYDHECGICNYSIYFIQKHDKENVFHFAPLQSHYFYSLKSRFFMNEVPDELILLMNDKIFTGYEAVIEIYFSLFANSHLLFLKKLFYLSPVKRIGKYLYKIIARNRKRLFNDKCYLIEKNKKIIN